ncbi:hypothetical protein ACTXT7_004121 [Hymenolepis weldensis]
MVQVRKGLRVNANADAYVETLQTIVVKLPWIDSVANGKPSMSNNKIRLYPMEISNPGLDDREFALLHDTKLMRMMDRFPI